MVHVAPHQSLTAWSTLLQAEPIQSMNDWNASVISAQILLPVSVWVKK